MRKIRPVQAWINPKLKKRMKIRAAELDKPIMELEEDDLFMSENDKKRYNLF